mmetsp:Transcript_18109/g.46374  ORF Transcript_18109/g.46374 Transcript_18109/m.46374 type:complete len:236 (-) Transcript_18109:1165-1872(-)
MSGASASGSMARNRQRERSSSSRWRCASKHPRASRATSFPPSRSTLRQGSALSGTPSSELIWLEERSSRSRRCDTCASRANGKLASPPLAAAAAVAAAVAAAAAAGPRARREGGTALGGSGGEEASALAERERARSCGSAQSEASEESWFCERESSCRLEKSDEETRESSRSLQPVKSRARRKGHSKGVRPVRSTSNSCVSLPAKRSRATACSATFTAKESSTLSLRSANIAYGL